MEELRSCRALIALAALPGLGPIRLKRWLSKVESPEALAEMSSAELESLEDLPNEYRKGWRDRFDWERADRILAQTRRSGAELVALHDPSYPAILRELHDPPPLLWCKGERDLMHEPCFSIVGTRSPSIYGRRMAEAFSKAFPPHGIVLVSGLAVGVDAIVHQSCLDADGRTIAVLGSGIDRVYPSENIPLAASILKKGGLLLTECVPGAAPKRHHFKLRNRMVSGLSRGVLVVESGIVGGSMGTAGCAHAQRRDVYAIPHPLGVTSGEGCNQLIRLAGAKLVQSPEDILSELFGHEHAQGMPIWFPEASATPNVRDLSVDELRILDHLGATIQRLDDISEALDIPMPRLHQLLLRLEIGHFIRQREGRRFERL